jgi:ABC-type nitrate/sulfonate/bicarbonate transport system substrate-binding protein
MKKNLTLFCVISLISLMLVTFPCAAKDKVIKISQFPVGPSTWSAKNMIDSGIYKKWGDKIGVEYQVKYPQDDFAAFMGRSVDIASFAPLEVTRLLVDEGKEIVIFGKYISNVIGWFVSADSTAKTPADMKGMKIGIPGWDTAAAQVAAVIMKDLWNLDMKKDFEIFTAPWPALPKLLAKGDIDMCFSLMPLVMKDWMGGRIKPLYETIGMEYAKHMNGYLGGVQFFCAWKDWYEENEETAVNFLSAYQEGIGYTLSNTDEWLQKYMPTEIKGMTKEQLEFMKAHYLKVKFLYYPVYLDEKFVKEELAFLKKAEDLGFLPKGSSTRDIFRQIK